MQRSRRISCAGALVAVLLGGSVLVAQQSPAPQRPQNREEEREQQRAGDGQSEEGFRFRTGVELINVSATVTDASGRFVPNLRKEDFVVFEDGEEQTITHFNAERVPVSLGIVLDTSGSMAGEKFEHAQAPRSLPLRPARRERRGLPGSLQHRPDLEQGWTTDKGRSAGRSGECTPRGGTAMYDAVAEAVPIADAGAIARRRCGDLRRQRHQLRDARLGGASSSCVKARCSYTRLGSTARARSPASPAAADAAASAHAGRFHSPSRAAAAASRGPVAAAAKLGQGTWQRRRIA